MPTINVEVLKQLLQEFSEKEALTTEEISVIEQEIAQLEKRIEQCQAKLQYLSEDKDKLASIRQRYAGNNVVPRIANQDISNSSADKQSAPKAKIKEDVAQPFAATPTDVTVTEEEPKTAKTVKTSVSSENIEEPEQKLDLKTEEKSEEVIAEESPTKEGGDTIKSINDALKGLFRK